MSDNKIKNQECCPPFDPEKWNDKVLNWENKIFVKTKVKTFLFMPINFGSAISRISKQLEQQQVKFDENICLSDHTSKWNMDIYIATDKEVKDAKNIKMNGKFYCRVYEGDFKQTENWCKDFDLKAKENDYKIGKMYMWYTTCPKCAKKYGKNYVAIIGKIEN